MTPLPTTAAEADGYLAEYRRDLTGSLWLAGRSDLRAWWLGEGRRCEGSRLFPHALNGTLGFAQYGRAPGGGPFVALALQVPTVAGGAVRRLDVFTDTALFPALALPVRLQ